MIRTENTEYYLSSCFGKEGHTARIARSILKRYPNATSYRCRSCGQWHIGNRQPQGKKIKQIK